VHTYIWINADNQSTFVRYTWKSFQGVESLEDEGDAVGQDWNYATMDLTQSINNGSYPSWELYVQLLKPSEKDSFSFNILDTTHQWPEDEIPMRLVGIMTLHENVQHHFLEAEQIAFAPSHMVPGILPSNEKMLQARIFSYNDAHRYRLGVNSHLIPINAPRCPFQQTQQDGFMNTLKVQNPLNYYPSNYANVTEAPPLPNLDRSESNAQYFTENGFKERAVIPKVDDFTQPGWRYSTWDSARQMRFARRIAATLMTPGVSEDLSDFWIQRWTNVSSDLGGMISKLIGSFHPNENVRFNKKFSATEEDAILFDNYESFRGNFIRSSGAV
jgi:catalase